MGRGCAQLGKALKGAGIVDQSKWKTGNNDREQVEYSGADAAADVKILQAFDQKLQLREGLEHTMSLLTKENIGQCKLASKRSFEKWRRILRTDKLLERAQEADIKSIDFMREKDTYDSSIISWDKRLDGVQSETTNCRHGLSTRKDELISTFNRICAARQHYFDSALDTLRNEFEIERIQIKNIHERNIMERTSVEAEVLSREDVSRADTTQFYDTEREHTRNQSVENINILRVNLNQIIEELEVKFDQSHLSYLESTEERTTDFHQLKDKDTRLSAEIERMIRRIDQSKREISSWRKKIINNQRDFTLRNSTLRNEKMTITKHYKKLKDRMTSSRRHERKSVAELCLQSRHTEKSVGLLLGKAQNVVKMFEIASKLESEHEQSLPFFKFTESKENNSKEDNKSTNQTDSSSDVLAKASARRKSIKNVTSTDEIVESQKELQNLLLRFNKAKLDTSVVRHHRDRLRDENLKLRSVLERYIAGINVSEATLRGPNPLLVINGRSNTNRRTKPRRSGKPVVVDANAVAANYEAQSRHLS